MHPISSRDIRHASLSIVRDCSLMSASDVVTEFSRDRFRMTISAWDPQRMWFELNGGITMPTAV
jgi:hypothetical protein